MAQGLSSQVERWLSVGGSIIAPATAITALLFYFGYVSSRAEYDYFGVDVDLVGLTTQDYVMRSPQPLLVPLLVLTLACALLLAVHTWIRRRVTDQHRMRRLARRTVMAGLGLVGIGVLLLFMYWLLREWEYHSLVTPLAIVVGGSLAGWGLGQIRRQEAVASSAGNKRRTVDALSVAVVLVWVAVAAGVFWATATIAQWSGRGLGMEQARRLHELPSVVIDTKSNSSSPRRWRWWSVGSSRSRTDSLSVTATGAFGC